MYKRYNKKIMQLDISNVSIYNAYLFNKFTKSVHIIKFMKHLIYRVSQFNFSIFCIIIYY